MRVLPDFDRVAVDVSYSEPTLLWRIRFCLWADGIDVIADVEGPTLAEAHAAFARRLPRLVSMTSEEAERVSVEFRKGARKFVEGQIKAVQREEAAENSRRKQKRRRLLDLRKELKLLGLGTFPQQAADAPAALDIP